MSSQLSLVNRKRQTTRLVVICTKNGPAFAESAKNRGSPTILHHPLSYTFVTIKTEMGIPYPSWDMNLTAATTAPSYMLHFLKHSSRASLLYLVRLRTWFRMMIGIEPVIKLNRTVFRLAPFSSRRLLSRLCRFRSISLLVFPGKGEGGRTAGGRVGTVGIIGLLGLSPDVSSSIVLTEPRQQHQGS